MFILAAIGYVFFVKEELMPPFQSSSPSSSKPQPQINPPQRVPSAAIESTPKVDASDWEVYRNEELGFEVRFPDSFAIEGDPSGTFFSLGPKSSSPFRVTHPLILLVIKPDQVLRVSDFGRRVIEVSLPLDNFQLHQQGRITFSGREAFKIAFRGALKHDPFRESGLFFGDESMEAVFIQHDPYIMALFIPQSVRVLSDIASTLILFDLHGGEN